MFVFQWDLTKLKAELLVKSELTRITTGPWRGIEDLTNIYNFSSVFPKPMVRSQKDKKLNKFNYLSHAKTGDLCLCHNKRRLGWHLSIIV